MKDDRVYLQHILDCIQRIEEDTEDGAWPTLPTPLGCQFHPAY